MSNTQIAVPEVTFHTLNPGKSSLTDALGVCLAAEQVEKRVKGAFTSVFDTMRAHAVAVYRQFLSEAKDKPEDIAVSSMVGVFLHECSEAEAAYTAKKPDVWNNYKSKLKLALENGINLQDNPTISFGKLSKTLKEINDNKEAAAEQAAIDAAAKDGKVAKHPATAANDSSFDESGGASNTSSTVSTDSTDNLLSGLSGPSKEILEQIISETKAMEAMGKDVSKMLGSTLRQFSDAHAAAMKKLAAV